jgi:hypothetical protein
VAETNEFFDDTQLEREMRLALAGREGEAEDLRLFRQLANRLDVQKELANSPVIKAILYDMWENVALFFDSVTNAKTLIGLEPGDALVLSHQRMQADFSCINAINRKLVEGRLAEARLLAGEDMERDQEDAEQ